MQYSFDSVFKAVMCMVNAVFTVYTDIHDLAVHDFG